MLKKIILCTGLVLSASVAVAGPAASPAVQVQGAWSRPAAAGGNGAGFFTIINSGSRPETLISVTSPLADRVEMHQTSMTDGIMSMQRIDAGVPLPTGQSVTFAPGGKHIMVLGLKTALKAGGSLPLTLTLASGQRLNIKAAVRLSPPSASHPK